MVDTVELLGEQNNLLLETLKDIEHLASRASPLDEPWGILKRIERKALAAISATQIENPQRGRPPMF